MSRFIAVDRVTAFLLPPSVVAHQPQERARLSQLGGGPTGDGLGVPAEIARHQQRLAALAQAKDTIKQRAAERMRWGGDGPDIQAAACAARGVSKEGPNADQTH